MGLNVDCVAYDLEDSVTSNRKDQARDNLSGVFSEPKPEGIQERAVRINAVESGLEEADLRAVVSLFTSIMEQANIPQPLF